jgi:hypothetical protein
MLEYHVDPARRIIVTRVTGRVSFGDFSEHLTRIFRDAQFNPEFNALIVAMDVAAVPAASSVSLMTPLVRAWSKRRAGARWAFVLPDAETCAFAETALAGLKLTAVTTKCFLAEAAAMAWLETPLRGRKGLGSAPFDEPRVPDKRPTLHGQF